MKNTLGVLFVVCNLCPRGCGVDRDKSRGLCGMSNTVKAARAALHFYEEPCISGKNGSGTIFFSGCSLKCCFCQNYQISDEGFGKEISNERLSDVFLELQDKGAHNINLVNPTHFTPQIIEALKAVKGDKLKIPIVYNTSGYERTEALQKLDGYIDIYLPDIKYKSPELSQKYSKARDYFDYASKAVLEMFRQTGKAVYDKNGLLKKGLVIRHLVLPGAYRDSIDIIDWISENLPCDDILLSIMCQYTPCHKSCDYPEINRRLTTFEYQKVVKALEDRCITHGYIQERNSATDEYVPPFNLEGI